ncbi:Tol-Pal system beta propeller repeat protein TolB [Paracoccus aerodenitrificans]|uniref:Tol-Pal system beta propeller repeat protein TolB n=1 Tax=Paracoccus aerodenitrificans TaxID=3017781 RepID=UPI0022F13E38|nr:Tol-Pal system beta propeller repeat protein TolB [Paracoccus aerodenitrificans]WBU65771.1 Tol-Pal system beta propeller repeat protein TolB [Paracoccus aerodenitrificans]
MFRLVVPLVLAGAAAMLPGAVAAQDEPLRIEITEGVMRPMPIMLHFEGPDSEDGLVGDIRSVIAEDLRGTGLFEIVSPEEGPSAGFDSAVDYVGWRMTQTEALVAGRVSLTGDNIAVGFRLFDIFAGEPLGDGMQFDAPREGWRRTAHKIADQIYTRITGEDPYFDSRIAFIGETGPATRRVKRVGVMDYDGAGVKWLTAPDDLVLSPRFSPDGGTVLYTSFASGIPQIMSLDVETVESVPVTRDPKAMSFAPRYSPDGEWIAFSRETAGNTDIWIMQVSNPGFVKRLTLGPSIDTAPSWSPDGQQIAFESDRSGGSQIYVMRADGSAPRRVSFGEDGADYGEPAWSPRGDRIAFTRHSGDGSQIGIMRPDGSDERLLTTDSRNSGPSWAPNGRVLIFTRLDGEDDRPALHSVDITGRNMRPVALSEAASDPAWGPLLP